MITDEQPDTGAHEIEAVHAGGDEAPAGDHAAPGTALRSPRVTAERERERLERTAGRSGPARLLITASLALRRLGSAEAALGGLRYRPVAWTVVAVLAVSWYLPGRVDRATVPEVAAAPSPVTTAVPSSGAPAHAEDPGEPEPEQAAPTPAFDPAPAPVLPPQRHAGIPDPSPPVTATTLPTATDATGTDPPAALTVRGSGWATRLPPTPLPADEVPEDGLPVANRIGSVDRVSFVRLAGDATTLELVEDEDSAREAVGTAAVAACAILDGSWAEEPAQSFDDAPEWEEETCVGGMEVDGRWSFDLSSFEDPTGRAGFALVPTTEAPADFQIAFLISS